MTARRSFIVGGSSDCGGQSAFSVAMSTEGDSVSDDTETADVRTRDTGMFLNPETLISSMCVRISKFFVISPHGGGRRN